MKTLIIHISDLHDSLENPIPEERFTMIARPLSPLLPSKPDTVLVLIGGDLADKGDKDRLPDLLIKIKKMMKEIELQFPDSSWGLVCVPGNHDHQFPEDSAARDAIAKMMTKEKNKAFSGSMTEVLLSSQNEFFSFAKALPNKLETKGYSKKVDSRIAWKHKVSSDADFEISCYNTSFMSQKFEAPGQLFLPSKLPNTKSGTSIALLHHPLNWLEAWNAKDVRSHLFENHSFIFTGHEHRGDVLQTSLAGGGSSVIVEAPLFWNASNSRAQGFTAVYLDTSDESHLTIQLLWDKSGYQPHMDGDLIDSEQSLIPINIEPNFQGNLNRWRFTSEFKATLCSTNLLLTHSSNKEIHIEDIFVDPDVRELTPESNYEKSRLIPGSKFIEKIRSKAAVFLTGADQSGKTAIAKILMLKFLDLGDVPILVDGSELPPHESKYRALLNKLCNAQYGEGIDRSYANLEMTKKVVIVDNYQHSPKSAKNQHRVLEMLNTHCSRLVILSDDSSLGPNDLAGFAIDTRFSVSVINTLPFSTKLQQGLVRKWLALDDDLSPNSEAFSQREVNAIATIGSMVGSGHIQPYPPYLLAIMQSVDAGTPVDLSASTHGHLYEAFITAALSKRRSLKNHSILRSFTAFLAYSVFKEGIPDFGEDFLQDTHKQWQEATDSSRQLGGLKNDLLQIRFLSNKDGRHKFSEKFIYYYFTASYLKDHIENQEAKDTIRRCIAKVWVEEYANILLFLAHLSKSSFLIKELVETANKAFSQYDPAELRGRLSFGELESLGHLEKQDDLENDKTRETDLDDLQNENCLHKLPMALDRNSKMEDLDFIGELSANLKMIQILGQFAKNFPTDFDPQTKVNIVEGSIELGLRTLGAYLNVVEGEQAEVLRHFTEIICSRKPNVGSDDAKRGAKVALTNLCLLSSFAVVKRISYSVGSSELTKTYGKIFDQKGTSPVKRLIQLSLELDHTGSFPEQKIRKTHQEWLNEHMFADRLLKSLVSRHFRLFSVPMSTRQSMGSYLNLHQNVISPPTNREKISVRTKNVK